MNRLRFLLDEHVAHAVRDQLLRLSPEIEVAIIGQAGMPDKGTLDPELLCWIEESGYILVTNNRRTMPAHLQAHFALGRHIAGMLLLRRNVSVGQVIENLFLLWETSTLDAFQDRVLFIPF